MDEISFKTWQLVINIQPSFMSLVTCVGKFMDNIFTVYIFACYGQMLVYYIVFEHDCDLHITSALGSNKVTVTVQINSLFRKENWLDKYDSVWNCRKWRGDKALKQIHWFYGVKGARKRYVQVWNVFVELRVFASKLQHIGKLWT